MIFYVLQSGLDFGLYDVQHKALLHFLPGSYTRLYLTLSASLICYLDIYLLLGSDISLQNQVHCVTCRRGFGVLDFVLNLYLLDFNFYLLQICPFHFSSVFCL